MKVSLTPDLERRIAEEVEAGVYGSPSEVVEAALRRLFEAEDQGGKKLSRLSRDIQVGIDEADRGEVVDGKESYGRISKQFSPNRP